MPKTPDYFQDKSIVITGAASGIGRATARIFAREGANVVCVDVNEDGVNETANGLVADGARALAIATDITSRDAVNEMAAKAKERFGAIDFLFNSADAAVARRPFLEIDDALWDKTFDINVKGTLYCIQALLPDMLEKGHGVIVNVASMQHRRGGPGWSVHYASAKAAIVTMTMGIAREFAERGVRCLSISPGAVNTAFQTASATSNAQMAAVMNDIPMKRIGEPEEIGEMVLFMCSDACEFMTADTVYINGGGGWR